ncbi:DUF3152 domain-containing protein [Streptomyces sp. NPDC013953]|uniref:DUF3152 domain-containing protein n=1 Tax=Streptomyces sp. NPDC013953 TaxID=3364868 RepID=UPI0036F6F340
MGRHRRKGPAATAVGEDTAAPAAPAERPGQQPGSGRRRKGSGPPASPPPPMPYDTPQHGTPYPGERQTVRGGHPEHQESGRYGDWRGAPRTPAAAGARTGVGAGARIPGPRREYLEAFGAAPAGEARNRAAAGAAQDPGLRPDAGPRSAGEPVAVAVEKKNGKPGKGLTFTGIAAAAVTTVLAVVVAGQVTDVGPDLPAGRAAGQAAERTEDGSASRSDERAVPPPQEPSANPRVPAAPVTYEQLMARQFPMDPKLKGAGEFEAVPGLDEAPGKGRKVRYRIDVEKGLGLDAELFAEAVQKTLNDDRSWAHGGAMTFERVSTGDPEFVVTLASPGTTGVWCAKSGLDTTIDNVSCDSAATERVMINAYRWAQGSETFGPKAMHAYRQMLINHEIGHRLGHNHVTCRTPGALAPVMQQQTKSLEVDGIKCRPNPWVFPGNS